MCMLFQMAVEEIGGSAIAGKPVAIQQEIVNVVGENKLLDGDAAGAQPGDEVDGLREVDVTVVVAVDEKHWRLPGVHRSDRGRFVGQLGQLCRNVLAVPVVGGPVVDAVEINASRENI